VRVDPAGLLLFAAIPLALIGAGVGIGWIIWA
jgi:hypothetical protein